MKRLVPMFVPAASALLALAAPAHPPRAIDSLVQAERRFSATSVEKGMRDAFVAFLAEDGIIFRPLPVEGKKLWQSRDRVPGTLIWEPSFAEVSAAGDIGYTTGPWEFRPPAETAGDAAKVACGHFISVWKRFPEGWRVAVDLGIQHERPERGVGSGDLTEGPRPVSHKAEGREAVDMPALDRALSEMARAKGIGMAIASQVTKDIRLNRDGFQPSQGLGPIHTAYDSVPGSVVFDTRGSGVAASRDLGYTYGIHRVFASNAPAPNDSGVYLHVWRREDGKKWKLALMVENPL